MLKGLFVIFGCLLIGEALKATFNIPVPAGVIGMVVFFIGLLVFRGVDDGVAIVSQGFINNLTLMFLASSVGIFFLDSRFDDQWPAIIGACVLGTLLAQFFVAGLLKIMVRPVVKESEAVVNE
jgi:holin-like protein